MMGSTPPVHSEATPPPRDSVPNSSTWNSKTFQTQDQLRTTTRSPCHFYWELHPNVYIYVQRLHCIIERFLKTLKHHLSIFKIYFIKRKFVKTVNKTTGLWRGNANIVLRSWCRSRNRFEDCQMLCFLTAKGKRYRALWARLSHEGLSV